MQKPRTAFTLVELLVVIAMMAVLAGLLLPAVQAARESAKRSTCENNLVQLIVAVHNYEMAHEHFPPGTLDQQGPIVNAPQGYHHNWIEELLPYLEQQNARRHVDRSVGVYHANNRGVRGITLPWLYCPTAASPSLPYSYYAAVHNDLETPIDDDNNGVFFLNSRVTFDDVSDGVGNTLFFGEKLLEPDDLGWMSGTKSTLRNLGTAPHEVKAGNVFFPSGPPPTTAPADPLVGGFGSFHRISMNFVCGDGHVERVRYVATLSVLQQRANRADGELLDPTSW